MKAMLFDLDDTLYPEIDFVKSGFRVVADYLGSKYNLNKDSLLTQMLEKLQKEGRGKIFNHLLYDLGLYSEKEVNFLVNLYRSHQPTIHLYNDAIPTLSHLRQIGIRLGIVTDGMASVQNNKIAALSLKCLFDVIICSDELGRECWKPSIIPYQTALDLLQVLPPEATYVGDDPSKDFISPNCMGMLTIQVKRQRQNNSVPDTVPEAASARYVVNSLTEIVPIIEEKH